MPRNRANVATDCVTVTGVFASPFTGPMYGESVSVSRRFNGNVVASFANDDDLSADATADGIDR